MGYGYGIWLVYDNEHFITSHIGHITVMCFMSEVDARRLYRELREKYPYRISVKINETPHMFAAAFYASDTNKIHSWGYNCESDKWDMFKNVCVYHNGDFSPQAHTSIEYNVDPSSFNPIKIEGGTKIVDCDIRLVDIRSDFPVDWHIIE